MNKGHVDPFKILIGQSLAVGIWLWFIAGWVFPFTTDSVIYISTAEHIARCKGLVFTNFFVEPAALDVLPLTIWPPGFPIGIALLKWMGINAYAAALIIPRFCCLCLPFLFFSIFRRFVPEPVSLLASGSCALMFSVLSCSSIAWSDTPYLALSLLTLIMAFNIFERKLYAHGPFIILTGIVSAVAFLVRYIGISLMASVGITLIIGALLKVVTFRDFIRTVFWYGLGVCLLVYPYCLRNLTVFGKLFYYIPPASPADFFTNLVVVIRLYFQGLSSMMVGTSSCAWAIPILMACMVAAFLYYARDLMREFKTKFICLVLVLVYFFVQSFFLIDNRALALNPLNPDVDERLLMQLSWILLGGGVCAVYEGLKGRSSPGGLKLMAAIFVLIFFFIQASAAARFYKHQIQIKALAKEISQYFPASKIPSDYVIISNVPEMTYFFAQRNVRALANYTPSQLLFKLGVSRKFVVFLVKGWGHLSPAWYLGDDWKKPVKYYKAVYSDEQVDLLVPQVKVVRSN